MATAFSRYDRAGLGSAVIWKHAAVVAVLGLLQRVLGPALVLVLFDAHTATKIGLAAFLGMVFVAHGFAQRIAVARGEADLFRRSVVSILTGDVLRRSVLAEADAHLRLVSAVYRTAVVVGQTLPNLCADLVSTAIVGAGLIALTSLRLVVVGVVAALLFGALWLRSRQETDRAAGIAWDQQAAVHDAASLALEGRLDLVCSGKRSAFLETFATVTVRWSRASVATAWAGALTGRIPGLVLSAATAGTLLVTLGRQHLQVMKEVALLATIAPALVGIGQGLQALATNRRWLDFASQIMATSRSLPGGVPFIRKAHAAIAFEKVSYRYSEGTSDVLSGVNFDWQGPGLFAIAGRNGSGKSTCLHLLMALARPSSGSVRINGQLLLDLDPDSWRGSVALLPQRPHLPARFTIRAAIHWLAPDASDERIVEALDRVGLLAQIQGRAQDPLDTRVDALSIGQRQRVALARLLSREADVYVFDEPDANLDEAGIAMVERTIRSLALEHLVVVVAHSPRLLEGARGVVHLSPDPRPDP